MLVLFGCSKEDSTLLLDAAQPLDLAIYERDSTRSDVYCDFKNIANRGCWNRAIEVSEDCHYNLLFTRYSGGWTGADATYSVALPDGKILWMFGDTFLGSVTATRMRTGGPLIRNTFILQDGDHMQTIVSGPPGNPQPIVKPTNPEEWYWPGDATVYQDELQWVVLRLAPTNVNGAFSFKYVGFDLAILSLPDLTLKEIINLPLDASKSYGAAILEDDEYTYLYGISDAPAQKRAHVARVAGKDLEKPWQYYNGADWTETPSDHIIANGVSDQFSVIKDAGKYYLITHEIIFGNRIYIAESDDPQGPFSNVRTLYCTPETGGNIFTYNSFVHPELSVAGELRISYNINSFDFNDIFMDADLYRPYFIAVNNWK